MKKIFLAVVLLAAIDGHAQVACPVPRGPNWIVRFVDSEELVGEGGQPKANAIDRKADTMWHTEWLNASPPPPHEIQIDLGTNQLVNTVGYLPRQDGCSNGWIARYEIYASTDVTNWGLPVATGTFDYGSIPLGCPPVAGGLPALVPGEMKVNFAPKTARYIRLRALTEVSGNPWTSAAEINIYGPVPFQITTTLLPTGFRGRPYSAQLEALGGTPSPAAAPTPVLQGTEVAASSATRAPLGDPVASAAPAQPALLLGGPQRRLPRIPSLPAEPPDVFDVSPRSGPVGTVITVHGLNFRPGAFLVSFGLETGSGKRVGTHYPVFVDSRRATVVVPPTLPPGPHDVYVDFPATGWHAKLTRAFVVTVSGVEP